MSRRAYDVNYVDALMEPYKEDLHGYNPYDLLENTENIVLYNEDDDLAIFENIFGNVYSGHYFFKSRGKKAYEEAKSFLDTMFKEYNADVIQGIVPSDHIGSRQLTLKLGFKRYGEIESIKGLMIIFILTKEEYANG